jgi:hypothetical protein
MEIGMRVKHSGHVVSRKRDYWNQQGRQPAKDRALDALNACVAERGTITAILAKGVEVTWDSGSVSHCLDYMVSSEGTK